MASCAAVSVIALAAAAPAAQAATEMMQLAEVRVDTLVGGTRHFGMLAVCSVVNMLVIV